MQAQQLDGFPAWLRPAPDSLLVRSRHRGLPPWAEFVHLLWTMWVFVTPSFTAQGYDARWLVLTLVSYPLFIALYLGTLVLPQRRVAPCAVGMMLLCLVLLPWYPGGMSYFVFGCVMLGGHHWRNGWHYAASLLLANVVLVVSTRLLGYPWTAIIWMPVTTLVVGLVVHIERQRQQCRRILRCGEDVLRQLGARRQVGVAAPPLRRIEQRIGYRLDRLCHRQKRPARRRTARRRHEEGRPVLVREDRAVRRRRPGGGVFAGLS